MSRPTGLLAGASLVVGLVVGGLVGYIIGNNTGRKEATAAAGTGPSADPADLLPNLQKDKVKTAAIQAENLAKAYQIYYVDHDSAWPASPQLLTTQDAEGNGPYIFADGLVDPWGKPFQVDVTGPHNRGPDVWTTDPQTGQQIGNWVGADE